MVKVFVADVVEMGAFETPCARACKLTQLFFYTIRPPSISTL